MSEFHAEGFAARNDSAISDAPRRRYVLVSPCRDEEEYLRRTLDSVLAQNELPALWVIVDDGSTDATPDLLHEYAARFDWIRVMRKPDRGDRAVGPGVVEAFYFGLQAIQLETFDYICKLDLDLELPQRYFSALMDRMEANPRLGSCSGKPYFRSANGTLVSEKCGDEMSVGMTKFYRTDCFLAIGGFVSQVMWDAIDCHKSRQLGWVVRSWDDPELRFEHLRPMGSSQKSVISGRMRHGFGQYYMGSDPIFFTASCLFRLAHPPYFVGALASWWGYVRAWIAQVPQLDDTELVKFVRMYQRQALRLGKLRAATTIEDDRAAAWKRDSDNLARQ